MDDVAVFHVRAVSGIYSIYFVLISKLLPIYSLQSEMNRKKGDFVFQTCHVIEIVTKLFLVIQNATAKAPEIHISPE